jgi:hypothetical protein
MLDHTEVVHPSTRRHLDRAHHHPHGAHDRARGWVWSCACGGRSDLTCGPCSSWREVLVGALGHSARLAA